MNSKEVKAESRLGWGASASGAPVSAYAAPGRTQVCGRPLLSLPRLLQALVRTTDPCSPDNLRAPTHVVPSLRLSHGTSELPSAPRSGPVRVTSSHALCLVGSTMWKIESVKKVQSQKSLQWAGEGGGVGIEKRCGFGCLPRNH